MQYALYTLHTLILSYAVQCILQTSTYKTPTYNLLYYSVNHALSGRTKAASAVLELHGLGALRAQLAADDDLGRRAVRALV